jgi:hypothetical protein
LLNHRQNVPAPTALASGTHFSDAVATAGCGLVFLTMRFFKIAMIATFAVGHQSILGAEFSVGMKDGTVENAVW